MKKLIYCLLGTMLVAGLVLGCAPGPPEEVEIEMLGGAPGVDITLSTSFVDIVNKNHPYIKMSVVETVDSATSHVRVFGSWNWFDYLWYSSVASYLISGSIPAQPGCWRYIYQCIKAPDSVVSKPLVWEGVFPNGISWHGWLNYEYNSDGSTSCDGGMAPVI